MDTNFEHRVRERAYEIWQLAGRGDGMAHEHWLMAEKVVANETGMPVAAKSETKAVKKSASKPVAKKSAAKKPTAKASKSAAH